MPSPSRRGCSSNGPAPIGAAAAAGPSSNRQPHSSHLSSCCCHTAEPWAPEPSIEARRHGWGYPGWGSHDPWEKRLKVTRKRDMSFHGREAGGGLQYPTRKFFCRTTFPRPPLMDDTARCYSIAAGPTRGTAAPLSQATCFSPWRPGRTTTRGTPAGYETRGRNQPCAVCHHNVTQVPGHPVIMRAPDLVQTIALRQAIPNDLNQAPGRGSAWPINYDQIRSPKLRG